MNDFVVLSGHWAGHGDYICDTPAKTVEALEELSLCQNDAYVINSRNGWTLLFYQGQLFTDDYDYQWFSSIGFNKLHPDLEILFADLLRRIFSPFVEDWGILSNAHVVTHPENPNCLVATIYAFFREDYAGGKDVYQGLTAELQKEADSFDAVEALYFCLD